MKYRIKIITYKNGRKEYRAYFKTWWGWTGLWSDGDTGYASPTENRNWALNRIDLHFAGNNKKQIVEFEYINK